MFAPTEPNDHPNATPPTPTIHVLKENKRPIGFAAWSTTDEKPKPKRTRKPKTSA